MDHNPVCRVCDISYQDFISKMIFSPRFAKISSKYHQKVNVNIGIN